jgi:Mg-chelatase subunit ChlD
MNKIYKIIIPLIILAFIVPAVTFAAWYNPVDWFRGLINLFTKEEKVENLHPGMNKTTGTVGFGEIFLKNGGKSFIFIKYTNNNKKKEYVNLFDLKNNNLKEEEGVTVYYNPSNTQEIIVYDLQGELIYKASDQNLATSTAQDITGLTSTLATTTTEKKEAIEIILDASGSMASLLSGESKMNIAKKAIETVINDVADDSIIGLRVYGSEGTYEEHNCTDTRLLFPINKINKTTYVSSVKSFSPKGWTPIDYVLRLSKNDFKNYADYSKKIILVSDGEETCGGNPCQAIKDLRNSGFDVVVDTIGFDVDAKTREQLKCISTASGGVYLDAVNVKQIEDILRVKLTPVPPITPVHVTPVQPIKPVPKIPPVVWPE